MAYVLTYDADCGPCTRFRNIIEFLDTKGLMSYLPLSEADRKGLLDSLPPELRFASFHLIDPFGNVTSGSEAIPKLSASLPGGRFLGAVLRMNPVAYRTMGMVYSVLSRLHDSEPCNRRGTGDAPSRLISTSIGNQRKSNRFLF